MHHGHCRASAFRATLRTSGEINATKKPVYDSGTRRADFPKMGTPRSRETQKAREDTMPHERGPLPVLPSEFFCLLSPIPKLASAARSPATLAVNKKPACRLVKPLTQRHLSANRIPPPEGLALPRICGRLRASTHLPRRAIPLRPFPRKNGTGRKDAQPLS